MNVFPLENTLKRIKVKYKILEAKKNLQNVLNNVYLIFLNQF
jgi:hypothetical protein